MNVGSGNYPSSEQTLRPGDIIDGHTAGYRRALARECPYCGAQPGRLCVTVNGGKNVYLHSRRYATQSIR